MVSELPFRGLLRNECFSVVVVRIISLFRRRRHQHQLQLQLQHLPLLRQLSN